MVAVCHNKNYNDFYFKKLDTEFDLVDVAYVDTNDLEEAYTLTNSINCHWSENDLLWVHDESKKLSDADINYRRSTSVGDVMFLGPSIDPDSWNCFVVTPEGFQRLPVTNISRLFNV